MKDIYCPGCGENMDDRTDYAELKEDKVRYWCISCARSLYNPKDVKRAIQYAKNCKARATQPLLVIATYINLEGQDCPVCDIWLGLGSKPIPQLSICDGGLECGVCGFFLPHLPSMTWREDGNVYGRPKKGKVRMQKETC